MAEGKDINNNEADVQEQDTAQENEETKQEGQEQETHKIGLLTWAILGAIVVTGSGGGYGLAKIFASPQQPEIQQEEPEPDPMDEFITKQAEIKTWEYNLDPVIANLDEPGVTRYIRVTLILKFNGELDQEKYAEVLESKKTELVDWLYQYMAGLNLDQVHGSRNIERFKMEVCRNFNDILFPGSKPFLEKILTKEFQIQ